MLNSEQGETLLAVFSGRAATPLSIDGDSSTAKRPTCAPAYNIQCLANEATLLGTGSRFLEVFEGVRLNLQKGKAS